MSSLEPAGNPPSRAPEKPSAADAALMKQFGVRFDGRCFRYQSYRYDALQDALRYAKADLAGAQPAPDDMPLWTEPEALSEAQQASMRELGISYDGRQYHYREYCYDHLSDALSYARRQG